MKKTLNIVLLIAVITTNAFAGVPIVTQMEVTDVTPASFAVTWAASEASVASLSVYQADCFTLATGVTTTVQKNDATGVIRAVASGLDAATSYCYQTLTTSVSTSQSILSPSSPVPVVTATAVLRTMPTGSGIVPFANDLLQTPPVYLKTVADTPDGVLEVLYLNGSKGPISVLLTNDNKLQYFNMNNLFDAVTGSSINLTGGERVRISERHGRQGCVIDRFRRVPADQEMTRATAFSTNPRKQDIDVNGTVNILDILRVVGGVGTAQGDACFNSDLDMMGHNKVDVLDVQSVVGSFDAVP